MFICAFTRPTVSTDQEQRLQDNNDTMELDLGANNQGNQPSNNSSTSLAPLTVFQKNILITTHAANIALTLLTLLGVWRENLKFVTFSMMFSLITLASFTINFNSITSYEIIAELLFFLLCLIYVICIRIKREYYNYDDDYDSGDNRTRGSSDTVVVPFNN